MNGRSSTENEQVSLNDTIGQAASDTKENKNRFKKFEWCDESITSNLPDEYQLNEIMSYLPIDDILSYNQASRFDHKETQNDRLWKSLVKRDFFTRISSLSLQKPKDTYASLKLSIWGEKEAFIIYMMANYAMYSKFQQRVGRGEFRLSPLFFPNRIARKLEEKNASQKALKKMVNELNTMIHQSDADFQRYYQSLMMGFSEDKKAKMRQCASDLFVNLTAGKYTYKSIVKQDVTMNTEFDLESESFMFAFKVLCHIQAPISIGMILGRMPSIDMSLMVEAYSTAPSPSVIKKLLEYNFDINQSFFTMTDLHSMRITPFMSVILTFIENIGTPNMVEVITLLLENGADPQARVYITDGDFTMDEFEANALTIADYCQIYKTRFDLHLKNEEEKRNFVTAMDLIINHKVEKKLKAINLIF